MCVFLVDCQEPTDIFKLNQTSSSLGVSEKRQKVSSEKHSADVAESLKKCTIHVTGMTCGSCVANIEKYLHKFKGECFNHPNGPVPIL